MPSVWALITSPTVPMPWPLSWTCSGVMVMSSTMTACTVTIPSSATCTWPCRSRSRRDAPGASVPTRLGGGRMGMVVAIANAPSMPTTVSANAPTSLSSDSRSASAPAGPSRFGPRTAPAVLPHTTVPMIAARRPSLAVSDAA